MVHFDALSDGEKCLFLSAFIVAANRVGPPVFFMWDEPDNHLALSEVGQFALALRKVGQRGAQFVATSHHPETIRKFSDDTTLVLTRKTRLDPTVPRPLADLRPDLRPDGDLIDALLRDEVIGSW